MLGYRQVVVRQIAGDLPEFRMVDSPQLPQSPYSYDPPSRTGLQHSFGRSGVETDLIRIIEVVGQ